MNVIRQDGDWEMVMNEQKETRWNFGVFVVKRCVGVMSVFFLLESFLRVCWYKIIKTEMKIGCKDVSREWIIPWPWNKFFSCIITYFFFKTFFTLWSEKNSNQSKPQLFLAPRLLDPKLSIWFLSTQRVLLSTFSDRTVIFYWVHIFDLIFQFK